MSALSVTMTSHNEAIYHMLNVQAQIRTTFLPRLSLSFKLHTDRYAQEGEPQNYMFAEMRFDLAHHSNRKRRS